MRKVCFGLVAFAAAAMASAQFDGPAPVAWRYQALLSSASGSPLVKGSTVYYTNGGRLVSLDIETGNKLWQFPQVEAIEGRFKGAPIAVDDAVVVASDNALIYSVDAKGGLKWSYHVPGQVVGQMISVGSYVVFRVESNQLMAVNAADGTPAWQSPYTNLSGIKGGIAALGSDILFYNEKNQLVSINSVTRQANWVVNLQNIATNTAPVVVGESIYLNCGNALVTLNALSHGVRWQRLLADRLIYNVSVTSEGIFGVTESGGVVGWDLSGTPLSKQPVTLGTQAELSPTAVGKLVVVPTTNGAVTLVDFNKSSVTWSYLMRPTADYLRAIANGTGAAGNGRRGGRGGGQGAGGEFGQSGSAFGGSQNANEPPPVTISAAAPAVFAGSTLLVAALDGSLLAFDKNLGVDLTAPSVRMTFPNPGDQVSGQAPLQLWFKIEDEASGVKASTLEIDIDGAKMDTALEKDGSAIVKFSLNGKNRLLTDGRKTITVTVADWLGNVRKQAFSLTIDNTLRPVRLPGSTTNQNGPGGSNKGGFNPGGGGGKG